MSKQAYKEFKSVWLDTYIKQYKEGNAEEKREIKNNVYKNTNLTEDEKNRFWLSIVMLSKKD